MVLAFITLALLGITLACFVFGTLWLAKYAFRLGTGPGIGVLLFPPYAFYFAFYQLEHERKDRPTALWMFGLVASVLLVLLFAAPLQGLLSGDLSALAAPEPEPEAAKTAPMPTEPAPVPTAAPAPVPSPPEPGAMGTAPVEGMPAGATPGVQPAPGAAPTGAAPAGAQPAPGATPGQPAPAPAPAAAPAAPAVPAAPATP